MVTLEPGSWHLWGTVSRQALSPSESSAPPSHVDQYQPSHPRVRATASLYTDICIHVHMDALAVETSPACVCLSDPGEPVEMHGHTVDTCTKGISNHKRKLLSLDSSMWVTMTLSLNIFQSLSIRKYHRNYSGAVWGEPPTNNAPVPHSALELAILASEGGTDLLSLSLRHTH